MECRSGAPNEFLCTLPSCIQLHGHESLVLIVTYDYQNKRFGLKPPKGGAENVPHLVLKVGEAVLRHKVKLSAALARMRVKSNAQSTTQLLPEASYLKYQDVMAQPYYTRVNRSKVHNIQADVLSLLQDDGLTACSSSEALAHSKRAFCHLQRNLVAFSPDLRGRILQHQLLAKGRLVPQACSLYMHTYMVYVFLCSCFSTYRTVPATSWLKTSETFSLSAVEM